MSQRKREAIAAHVMGSAAPPAPLGAGAESAEPPAINGGIDGLSLEGASAWDVIAGQGQMLSDLREFMDTVEAHPEMRAAATLQALGRIREALKQVSEMSDADELVPLTLQDVALLTRQLLSRLR